MIIDTSALVGILDEEPDAERLVRAIATAVKEATRQRLDCVRRERVNLAESLLGIELKPPPAAKARPGKLVTQPLE